ncbi:MAG: hypothetical protein FGM14_16030 [Flavobacteriales bacterium]|nr:hypothetical protein [Flavobacteriales bacterium]
MKTKTLLTALIAILLQSCIGDGMSDDQREFYSHTHKISVKEKKFMYELEKLGYEKIKITSPSYEIDDKNSAYYFFHLTCPFEQTLNNKDSIRNISDSLADILYSRIISDSVLDVCQVISINLNLRKSNMNANKRFLSYDYNKKKLEIRNGFKVIEVREGVFKRVSVK